MFTMKRLFSLTLAASLACATGVATAKTTVLPDGTVKPDSTPRPSPPPMPFRSFEVTARGPKAMIAAALRHVGRQGVDNRTIHVLRIPGKQGAAAYRAIFKASQPGERSSLQGGVIAIKLESDKWRVNLLSTRKATAAQPKPATK